MVKSAIELFCESKGIKLTHQRKVIAKVVSKAIDHPDANLIFKKPFLLKWRSSGTIV